MKSITQLQGLQGHTILVTVRHLCTLNNIYTMKKS